ncbi:MAG: hypothetical protein OHK0021_05620 [Bryobacter sp.]
MKQLIALLALVAASATLGEAQVPLTTIQDTIYLADGKKFSGLVFFDWKSFEAPNQAVIGQYNKVVRVTDGVLRVQLAPTITQNNAYYSVRYSSGGRILFSEVWSVVQSNSVLRLRDVRATLLPGGFVSSPTTAPTGGSGLPAIGESSEGDFVDGEIPAGLLNGSNVTFTLATAPSPAASLELYLNGILLSPGVDYTLATATITFVNSVVPQSGDTLRAYYRTGSIGTSAHNLLSAVHSDTAAGNVERGDLITGQGSTAAWTRLPLGAANRCLISNGADAVWNACLFTGFTAGTVPFTNTSGLLSQDALFTFDATNRRLGIGTEAPSANLTIQAGASQGSTNLTRWLNAGGTELARMESDGALVVQRLTTSTTTTRSAWRDTGSPVDPSSRSNGDFWFNNSQQARKSYEAGQVHPLPQVLCSSTAPGTSATTSTSLGTCFVPSFFFDAGDRIEVFADYEHTGSASGFSVELRFGGQTVWTRTLSSSTALVSLRGSGGLHGTGTLWGNTSFTNTGNAESVSSQTSGVPTSAFSISFRANLSLASGDTVTLRNFSVVRYPAQSNP